MARQTHERVLSPARLEALHQSGALDSNHGDRLDRITRLATALLGTPVSLVSLVDFDRQVFVSQAGLPEPWAAQGETPLTHSFCQHVVSDDAPLVVSDARLDPRLQDNMAIGDLNVVAYCGVPLRNSDGLTLGSFCVIDGEPRVWTEADIESVRDLAGLVQVELRLAEVSSAAESDASALVAGLAHDIRGMLTSVVGGARMLGAHDDMNVEQRSLVVGVVERQADQLGALMERLLDIGSGQTRSGATDVVNVSELIVEVALSYEVAGIDRVTVEVVPDLRAAADPVPLRRCVTNLIENALRHAGPTAQVRVTGAADPDQIVIRVADDGPGIALDQHALVFERRRQGTGHGEGYGLGLSIVHELIDAMGGSVALASAPGEGATFIVRLPRAD